MFMDERLPRVKNGCISPRRVRTQIAAGEARILVGPGLGFWQFASWVGESSYTGPGKLG